ncbi:MAG: radical SAM protein, partial [Eggerthellaceae bacterium]|nr:radical SAM protein [Eggerthellaceae bacterium]
MAEYTVEEVLSSFPPFAERIDLPYRVSNANLSTFQINIGYKCNLACRHCHLQCSPSREEEMNRETMRACLDACVRGGFKIFDITGGAPEMNPHLQWLIEQATALDLDVVVRTNLTILLEPEYEHLLNVYADNDVNLFASLPYYSATTCDKIRGGGVFNESIKVLKKLNELGYGRGKHTLSLV